MACALIMAALITGLVTWLFIKLVDPFETNDKHKRKIVTEDDWDTFAHRYKQKMDEYDDQYKHLAKWKMDDSKPMDVPLTPYVKRDNKDDVDE